MLPDRPSSSRAVLRCGGVTNQSRRRATAARPIGPGARNAAPDKDVTGARSRARPGARCEPQRRHRHQHPAERGAGDARAPRSSHPAPARLLARPRGVDRGSRDRGRRAQGAGRSRGRRTRRRVQAWGTATEARDPSAQTRTQFQATPARGRARESPHEGCAGARCSHRPGREVVERSAPPAPWRPRWRELRLGFHRCEQAR